MGRPEAKPTAALSASHQSVDQDPVPQSQGQVSLSLSRVPVISLSGDLDELTAHDCGHRRVDDGGLAVERSRSKESWCDQKDG